MRAEFNLEQLNIRQNEIYEELLDTIKTNGIFNNDTREMEETYRSVKDRDKVNIVMIGEYSCGKSTIISALTGRQDIAIDSDECTDTATDYQLGTYSITDTPGLYTETEGNEKKTRDAINRADLIIYVITPEYFTPESLADFKRLINEDRFDNKIIIAVNKAFESLSSYGVQDQYRQYTEEITKQIGAENKEKLSGIFCFSAKKYIQGKENHNDGLIDNSYFDDFIDGINEFVNKYIPKVEERLIAPYVVLKEYVDRLIEQIPLDNEEEKQDKDEYENMKAKILDEEQKICGKLSNIARQHIDNIERKYIERYSSTDDIPDEDELKSMFHDEYEVYESDVDNLLSQSIISLGNEWHSFESGMKIDSISAANIPNAKGRLSQKIIDMIPSKIDGGKVTDFAEKINVLASESNLSKGKQLSNKLTGKKFIPGSSDSKLGAEVLKRAPFNTEKMTITLAKGTQWVESHPTFVKGSLVFLMAAISAVPEIKSIYDDKKLNNLLNEVRKEFFDKTEHIISQQMEKAKDSYTECTLCLKKDLENQMLKEKSDPLSVYKYRLKIISDKIKKEKLNLTKRGIENEQ